MRRTHHRRRRIARLGRLALALAVAAGAILVATGFLHRRRTFAPVAGQPSAPLVPPEQLSSFQRAVVADLDRQVRAGIRYQDGYFEGGDPPAGVGVCTDVVIRAYRAAGVDLRREVARDVLARQAAYHLQRPDPNIDHRRCRNLVVFFQAHAEALPPAGPDWQPGDVVFRDVGAGVPTHVGMVANHRDAAGNPTVVHHWPGLPVSETDGLHRFRITHHFRWRPAVSARMPHRPTEPPA